MENSLSDDLPYLLTLCECGSKEIENRGGNMVCPECEKPWAGIPGILKTTPQDDGSVLIDKAGWEWEHM